MAAQVEKEYISYPKNSRPFNLAVWTEDPGLVGLVQEIWGSQFAAAEAAKRGRNKPKRPYIEQLRVLIADLFLVWQEDEYQCLGVPFSEGAWDTRSRYNPHQLSKHLIEMIHRLEAAGLVRVSAHSYAGPAAKTNRNSRVQASHWMQEKFRGLKIEPGAIWELPREPIILKSASRKEEDEGPVEKAGKPIDYDDTDETRRMRGELQAYNALLARTFIDIPTLDQPWVTRKDKTGKEIRVAIGPRNQFVRRIFSRGSWSLNGRFYGPWWQGINSKLRSQIFINDTPTVEIDFRSMHIQILAAGEGVEVIPDPYVLPAGQFPGVDEAEQRKLVKLLVLTALNARNLRTACSAFRNGLENGDPGKHLKDSQLKKALLVLKRQVPWLHGHLCNDEGIGLMFDDSQIVERVIKRCTDAGLPVLTVHDSVIVPVSHRTEVRNFMVQAAEEVVGRPLPLSGGERKSGPRRAVARNPLSARKAEKKGVRCIGYLQRLKAWEGSHGHEVVSLGMKQRKARAG